MHVVFTNLSNFDTAGSKSFTSGKQELKPILLQFQAAALGTFDNLDKSCQKRGVGEGPGREIDDQ